MDELISIFIIVLILTAGVVGSLWRTRKVKFRAEPQFQPAAVDELPEAATQAMAEAVESLTPAGYVVEVNVHLPGIGEDTGLLLMAFVQRVTATLALYAFTLKPGEVSKVLSVQTRLVDGTLIETVNSDLDPPMPRRAGVRSLAITRKLDHVHEIAPADLVNMHACRVRGEVAPLPADMMAYLQEERRSHTQWLLSTGYFKRHGEWVRLTLRGRVMIALRSNFFVAGFANIRRELATDHLLRRWRAEQAKQPESV